MTCNIEITYAEASECRFTADKIQQTESGGTVGRSKFFLIFNHTVCYHAPNTRVQLKEQYNMYIEQGRVNI